MPSELICSIAPFYVMDVLERAKELEARGVSVVHFEVGEPDVPTDPAVCEAAVEALRRGETKYTPSMGLSELREAISEDYAAQFGVEIRPDNVVVTMGSSPALFLAVLALIEPGDEVVITDPHYSCYPQIIRIAGGVPVRVPIYEDEGFQLDVSRVRKVLGPRTRALVVNSPANPTGVVLEPEVMREVASLGLPVISDEIYTGIVYEGDSHTMLEFSDRAVVVSGFSKLYAMTGWRLGYMVVPDTLVRGIQKLQQNLFISPNPFVQRAGVAALRKAKESARRMVAEYGERRRAMIRGLRGLGFDIKAEPRGAFYVFVKARWLGGDSLALAFDILDKAHVALTPGIDFGPGGEGYLRFSYATARTTIEEGLSRLKSYLERYHGR